MDTEPTDTEQLSPGTTDEENNNEDITETDDNVLYYTYGQCGGQIRFDKNDALKFDDLQQNSQQLGTKMSGTPYNVTDNRLLGYLIEPS